MNDFCSPLALGWSRARFRGLTPTVECVVKSNDDALLRSVRHVDLPQLSQPGVYVVDFVGNGRKPVVVTAAIPSGEGEAEITSLDFFEHAGESHELRAGIHVDRESLRTRAAAEVLLRPTLFVNGRPVSLAGLESPKLTIQSVDLDGVPALKRSV